MKKKDLNKFRSMQKDEIEKAISEKELELAKLISDFQGKSQTRTFKSLRRDLAQIKTILKETGLSEPNSGQGRKR